METKAMCHTYYACLYNPLASKNGTAVNVILEYYQYISKRSGEKRADGMCTV